MISVKVLRSAQELEAIQGAWKELLSKSFSDNPFLSWEWASAWLKVYFHHGRLLVVAVYDNTTLIGLAPLWVHEKRYAKFFKVRSLEFLGSGITCPDHLDLIVLKKKADVAIRAMWDQLFGALAGEWDIFAYHHVPGNSPVLDRLLDLADNDHRCPRRVMEEYTACPCVELPNSWEAYLESLPADSRRDLRTSVALLSEVGALELRPCRTPENLQEEMERFIALHQAGWKERGKPGSFSTEGFRTFHQEVARNLLASGMLFLCSLWLGDKQIGSLYGYQKGGKVYYYLSGIERDTVKKAGTGRVLVGLCIEEAIKMGCTGFDMLRGREAYKYEWTKSDPRDISVTFYKTGLRTVAFACSEHAFQFGKLVAKTILGDRSESISRWRRRHPEHR